MRKVFDRGGPPIRRRAAPDPDPEALAIQALAYIAGDPDQAERFMALSGLAPDELRGAAADPGFLLGVLDHVVSDEPLLLQIAARIDVDPEALVRAHARMGARR